MTTTTLILLSLILIIPNVFCIWISTKLTKTDISFIQILIIALLMAFLDPILLKAIEYLHVNRLFYIGSVLVFAIVFKLITDEDFWPECVLNSVVVRLFNSILIFILLGMII